MGSIYVCPKCEVEVKYSKLFCSCGTQLVRTDDALADDVFRKYRESNGIEVPKTDNEGKTKTSQDVVNEADTSLGAKENTNKHESVNVKNILIQTIYFISTFWVFAGFTLSYASYVSYLSLFLITLIVYVAIYKINLGNYSASVKKTTYWSLFAGVFLMVAVMDINPYLHRSIEFISKGFDYGTCSIGRMFSSPPKLRLKDAESDARLLYENSAENISPVYLNNVFRNGTDLQKTNTGRSINGKFVKWRLKVDNISEFYGKRKIKITTQAGAVDSRSDTTKQWQGLADSLLGLVGNQLFSPIYENQNIGVEVILDLEANDPAYLNLLKSDDWIVVRGKIDDVVGDRIRLSPALIENSHTLALYTTAKNKINQHKSELQKYNEKSCMLNLSSKKSDDPIVQVNNKSDGTYTVNESKEGLPYVTIKEITEYNSKCLKPNSCSWNALFKTGLPLTWEKYNDEYYEKSYKSFSKDFEIHVGGGSNGHDYLGISSPYKEGKNTLRKKLESTHVFVDKICSKSASDEDIRNYIYETNNGLLFIVYKIEAGYEGINYFYEPNPYELIKRNLRDIKNMVKDNCPY